MSQFDENFSLKTKGEIQVNIPHDEMIGKSHEKLGLFHSFNPTCARET